MSRNERTECIIPPFLRRHSRTRRCCCCGTVLVVFFGFEAGADVPLRVLASLFLFNPPISRSFFCTSLRSRSICTPSSPKSPSLASFYLFSTVVRWLCNRFCNSLFLLNLFKTRGPHTENAQHDSAEKNRFCGT